MTNQTSSLNAFIASPLEQEHVDRIRSTAPPGVNIIYEPDLLPPIRYIADHIGRSDFVRNTEQEKRWREHLAKADILWSFPPPSADGSGGFSLASNVKWVQTTSSGVGQLIKRLNLVDSDLLITTARGIHAGPLTEFVFMVLLNYFKKLRHLHEEQEKHHWARFCGDELHGKTLAVIGAGEVGRQALRIGRAFGMKVIALNRPESNKTAQQLEVDELFPSEKLHDLLAVADALVLSVPHTEETENLIDRAALNALKSGCVFINIARGIVVDEEALIDALRDGKIAFAGLDVFTIEPLPAPSPLWDMPNVLISPHSASTAKSENGKITDIFCHNLLCYMEGRFENMRNVFNKTRLY